MTVDLSFEVTFQNCNALLIGITSSLQVFDLSSQGGEVALTQLVRLNLGTVGCYDPFANILTDLCNLILFLVLLLNFLVFDMLSLFPLFTMLLVVAEGRCVPSSIDNWMRWWNWYSVSSRRA